MLFEAVIKGTAFQSRNGKVQVDNNPNPEKIVAGLMEGKVFQSRNGKVQGRKYYVILNYWINVSIPQW